MMKPKIAMRRGASIAVTAFLALQAQPVAAQPPPLAQRVVHYDIANVKPCNAPCHYGVGTAMFTRLLAPDSIDAPLGFMDRGYVSPHSSIGEHFHSRIEGMFVIFDGEAQVTIDGRTSTIKGPAVVPNLMGHAHAIYNATDKPVSWMDVQVAFGPGFSSFDVGDSRVGAPLDPIPQFINAKFDRTLLRPIDGLRGGKGVAQYRRVLDGAMFTAAWSYVDHVVLPPGASIGPQAPVGMAEIYYVVAGAGSATVGAETAAIKADDVLPVDSTQTRSVVNDSSQALELIVLGVAKDLAAREAFLALPRPPRASATAR
jgi:mannose-6-phosphate isomerase-like protein (cupin superfamily)